ncbi:hypothetical protein [Acetobacterium wieringae]|uniref:hypothetical protein n=1 Tax=Acetobacterium wieringae TaxID=52694 RepID=UPI001652A686|nr:hypothetical protein [Acetobacterium wieringae]
MDSKYNDTVYINRTKFTITNTNDDRNMGIINQNTDIVRNLTTTLAQDFESATAY